ncbi:cobalamin-binding protein [Candidatus Gottesmanbacteria bacterium]|nr:cobalamin-binding protein [Candidatus Gottesmanbacteria bacterium]
MRIVSLAPSVTEILFAIGAGEYIVANTSFCDFPPNSRILPKVGSWIYINDEKISSFSPDIVITSTVVQHKGKERFEKKNFRHIHLDPRGLEDIYKNILFLGNITGKMKESEKVVDSMKAQEEKLVRNQPKKKLRVYIEEWFDPPMVSGNWVPDIVSLAGGEYILKERGGISRKISLSEVEKFDPYVMFISYCGFKDRSDPQKILRRNGWEKLGAIKNKKVFILDDTFLNRPGPRILESARRIQSILHSLQ